MVSEPHVNFHDLPSQEPELISKSPAMRQLRAQLERVAAAGSAALFFGEPGVGKGFLAEWLHDHGPRARSACLTLDLTQISPDHHLALFSDAGALPTGLGTLCLKHVDLLARDAQPALVGRSRGSCRLVATSTRSLESLSTLLVPELLAALPEHLRVPALRERPEDFGALAARLASLAARRLGRGPIQVSEALLERLSSADWPGNAAQLLTVLSRAVAAAGNERELSPGLLASSVDLRDPSAFSAELSYRDTRLEFEGAFERAYVSWLLHRHDGNISAAAREARMDRKHLYDLARKHGLRRPRGND
jgi:two-component system response regulator GlrR